MEYLFAVYSVFSFSHSEVDILLQTQCLSLNFDAKIYISAVRSQNGIEQLLPRAQVEVCMHDFDYHESKLAHVHHILDKFSFN